MLQFLKTKIFTKLYRYYCRQLAKRWGVVALWSLYFLVLLLFNLKFIGKQVGAADGWSRKLAVFWGISFFQLIGLMMAISPLVSTLVGRGLGWEELKRRQFFAMPKLSREQDIKTIIFCPRADRQTMVFAKFAAVFTYFLGLNFLFCLPLAVYFLAATPLGIAAVGSFLLLNGIILALVNFALLVPFLFYQQEGGSFLVYFLCFMFVLALVVVLSLCWEFIAQYPLVFILASVPLSVLTGYGFFTLYRQKFLTQDLC